jgi:spermidine synthase
MHKTYGPGKVLSINDSGGSYLNREGKAFEYIESVKKILFKDLKLRGKDILVIGAGGFTLSAESDYGNHFFYNDIDPEIKALSEKHFNPTIRGEFIPGDARVFLASTQRRFDVVFSDAYNNVQAIPFHLVTREHFENIRRVLRPGGYAVFNVLSRPTLRSVYGKRMDSTLRSVFGNCMVMPDNFQDKIVNIIYVCSLSENEGDKTVYTDNLNSSTLDYFQR